MMTGVVQTRKISNASHGPGRRRCARAAGQSAKKIAQHAIWQAAVYLQRKPRPMARPTTSQSRVLPSGCAARQPATSAHIQHNTIGGSVVIKIVPMPSNGAAVTV